MTYSKMEDDLKERLEQCLSENEIKFRNKDNVYVDVNVITGELPPRNMLPTNTDNLPYILIVPHKGKTNEERTTSVMLLLGIVAGDEIVKNLSTLDLEYYKNARKDLLKLIQTIERDILKNKMFTNFSFKRSIEWEIYLEQPYPVMYGEIGLVIEMPDIEHDMDDNTVEEDY